jgi:hypothetical protein
VLVQGIGNRSIPRMKEQTMDASTMVTVSGRTHPSSRAARAAVVTGTLAALLTTVLAFLALALSLVTFVLGGLAFRRSTASRWTVAGVAMAAVSTYVIALEMLVVG